MLSMTYYLFIAPLEWLMETVLASAHAFVDSYGWAIVILSLAVNTALLPIYGVAEGWQEDERRLRRKMAPKEAEIRSAFKGQERHVMLRTLQRQNGYTQILPLRSSAGFLLQVPFFFAAYHLLSHADYLNGVSFGILADLGSSDRLISIGGVSINALPLVMTAVNLVSAFVYTHDLSGRDKIQLYGLAMVFLAALYESPAALTLYWTLNNVYSLGKNIVYARLKRKIRPKKISAPASGAWTGQGTPFDLLCRAADERKGALYAGAVVTACAAVFLYAPILFYASDPTLFSNSFETIVAGLMRAFWAALLLCTVLYHVTAARLRAGLSVCASFFALVGVLYLFFFTGDYGVLNGFFLEKTALLRSGRSVLYDMAIFAVTGTVFVLLLMWRQGTALAGAMGIVGVSLTAVAFVEGGTLLRSSTEKNVVAETAGLPAYNDTLLSFSRLKPNVVIVVLDMFTGDHLGRMLQEEPDLAGRMTGFVWYRDTLSTGSGTHLGLVPIHGGTAYTPFAINARERLTYREEYVRSYSVLSDFFAARDTSVAWGGTMFATADEIATQCATPPDVAVTHARTIDDYFPYWKQKTGFVTTMSEEWPFLAMNGVFRIVPYSLRSAVYQRGKWRLGAVEGLNAALYSARGFAFLDTLSIASNARSERPTFKYVYTDASHEGKHFTLDDGRPTGDVGMFAALRDAGTFGAVDPAHYASERASLLAVIRWMEWMRREGVYDNTRLIIAADHGGWDSQALLDTIGKVPYRGTTGVPTDNPGLAYPLLMVKDFNSEGPLRISDVPMSNADVPDLAVKGIGELPEELRAGPDTIGNPQRHRFYASLGLSPSEFDLEKKWLSFLTWRVRGGMFDPDNWKLLN